MTTLSYGSGVFGDFTETVSGGTTIIDFFSVSGFGSSSFAGTTVDGTVVAGSGHLNLYAGATANNTTVSSGGQVFVNSGAVATNITVSSGGFDDDSGDESGITIDGGGVYVEAGGTANGTISINESGTFTIDGTASGTININSGGTALNYGAITGAVVNSGAIFNLSAGTANNTVIDGGGETYIYGGTDIDTTINSGGTVIDWVSGLASNTIVSSGGVLSVYDGGRAFAPVIASGGTVMEDNTDYGSSLVVDPIISGGTLILNLNQRDDQSYGSIAFAPGTRGTLLDYGYRATVGVISGFAPGDVIDLGDLPWPHAPELLTLGSGNVLDFDFRELQFDPLQNFGSDVFEVEAAPDGSADIVLTSGGFSVSFSGALTEGGSGTLYITNFPAPTSAVTIQLAVEPGTAPASDIVGLPSSVVLSAGQSAVSENFQIETDPLATSDTETFGISASSPVGSATASGNIGEFVTAPYEFTAPEGGFVSDSLFDEMTATGTVNVGLSANPGTPLITISDGSASYDDSSFTGSGTVYEDETGKDYALFQGSFTLSYPGSGTSTSDLTDTGAFAGKFDLGGLPVTFTQLTFEPDAVLAGFSLALPFSDGTSLTFNSPSGINDGLLFDSSGAQIELGGSVSLPNLGPVNVFGLFTGSLGNASLSYIAASDTLQLQGVFSASQILGSSIAATVNLAGSNFIQFQDGTPDFAGTLSITGLSTPTASGKAGFGINEIDLSVNTIDQTFGGEINFTFPFGGSAPEGDVKIVGAWSDDGPVVDEVDVAFSNLGVVIPETPDLVWQNAAVSVTNMFDDAAPTTFAGSLGFSFGPKIAGSYVGTLTLSGSGSSQKLSASEQIQIVPYSFVSNLAGGSLSGLQSLFPIFQSTGNVTANFANSAFQNLSFAGTTQVLGNFITTSQSFQTDGDLDFTIAGMASVNFGDSIFNKIISYNATANANYLISYNNSAPLTGDFAEAWFTTSIDFGVTTKTFTIGAKSDFDGDVSVLYGAPSDVQSGGAIASAAAVTADITPSSEAGADTYLFLTASWTNAATGPVTLTVTDPHGTVITQDEFTANNIAIVSALSTAYSETVAVLDPSSTTDWSVQVSNANALGTVSVAATQPDVAPTIASLTLGTINNDGTLAVAYNVADASTATLALYADQNGDNFNGILLGDTSGLATSSGSVNVSLDSLGDGVWQVYGLVTDGVSMPSEDYASEDVLIANGEASIVTPVEVTSGETLTIPAGQTSAALDIQSGGTVFVASGATVLGTTIEAGGTLTVQSGGTADPTIVSSGGTEVVDPSGTDLGALVQGGGLQIVLGMVSGVTVETGGEQYVGSAGMTLGAQIDGGGAEVVFGTDSGANLSGTQYDFGTATGGTTVSGAYQLVAPGATASGMTIDLGGQQYVGLGGTTLGAQVEHGGAEVVIGTDSGANLSGTQYLYGTASGGTTYGDPLSGSFIGYQLIASGATGIGMTVLAGGYQYIGSGGTAVDTDVASQGVEVIFGTDSGALISGTQYDFAYASGGTTYSGGYQLVAPAGFGAAIDMTVLAGGQQYVVGGGTASGTQVMSRGVEIVHGTDLNATISGTQYVDGPSGLASGTVVATGGYQLVGPGATISAVSISGGTIELQGGASDGTAPITFTGAGDLLLDASTSFSGTVAGFGKASLNDTIDFADIPYVAAGSAGATTIAWSQLTSGGNASGTLMVSQGGHTADITLLGQYAAGNFTASSDGQGGTLVTDPPLTIPTDLNPQVLATTRNA